jgi:hypothetical protein
MGILTDIRTPALASLTPPPRIALSEMDMTSLGSTMPTSGRRWSGLVG